MHCKLQATFASYPNSTKLRLNFRKVAVDFRGTGACKTEEAQPPAQLTKPWCDQKQKEFRTSWRRLGHPHQRENLYKFLSLIEDSMSFATCDPIHIVLCTLRIKPDMFMLNPSMSPVWDINPYIADALLDFPQQSHPQKLARTHCAPGRG